MKGKILSIIIILLFITPVFSIPVIYGGELRSYSINHDYRKNTRLSNNKGKASLGFIIVDSVKATGMPDQHNGIIINANITFSESTHFLVIHIPLIFIVDRIDTNISIHLSMDLFWGRSDYQSNFNNYRLIGFAREITWEW